MGVGAGRGKGRGWGAGGEREVMALSRRESAEGQGRESKTSIQTALVGLAPGPAVYLVFAVLSILGWFLYIMYCVCECCCPP